MAWAKVQSGTINTTGTSGSVTLGSAITAGDLLWSAVRQGGGSNLAQSTSDGHNTWAGLDLASDTNASPDTLNTDYAANVASWSYAITVTASSNGVSTLRAIVAEFSGGATTSPLRDNGSANGT